MKFTDAILLNRVIKSVREGVFPPICLKCRKSYRIPNERYEEARALYANPNANLRDPIRFRRLMTAYLCSQCQSGFYAVESPLCPRCGIMFKSREGSDHLCGKCLKSARHFRKARAFAVYNEMFKDLIYCYKYRNKIQLEKPFSFILFSIFIRYWDARDIDIIAPVPLHWRRMYQRGFNQAFLMVRKWRTVAKTFQIDLTSVLIEREIIVRTQQTASQVGMSVKDRQANIKNAFAVKTPEKIKGKRILLIDDVLTTGSTVNECARILMNNGARYVDVLTLAQAIKSF